MMSVSSLISKTPVRLAIVISFGMWFTEFFPDPYQEDGLVDVFTWAYREIGRMLKLRRERK